MKAKLLKIAALSAFVLAVAGCGGPLAPKGEQESSSQTPQQSALEAALSAGGVVDLSNHQVSPAKTYIIAKTATIKGDAKGASFTVSEGAAVTFDGMQNIGTVSVGSPASAKAAFAERAAVASTSVILKGGNVKIGKMFIYVECTLSSDSEGNSFGSVVAAANVASLALEGKTKISSLVMQNSGNITITASASVKIEKADSKVIEAVKKNPGVQAPSEISKEESDKLKEDFTEESQKPASGNFIKSKADLIACVKNVIKEYYDFGNDLSNKNSKGRAAATKPEITRQLTDFMKKINDVASSEAKMKLLQDFFLGRGATGDFSFNAELSLTDVGISDALDGFIDAYNDSFAKNSGEKMTKETIFGGNLEIADRFLKVGNANVTLPKLYALGELKINKNNAQNYASAAAKVDVQAKAGNVNRLILDCLTEARTELGLTYIPETVDLPVKEIGLSYKVDANAAMSKANYDAFVEMIKNQPESPRLEPSYYDYENNIYIYKGVKYDNYSDANKAYMLDLKVYYGAYKGKITTSSKYKLDYSISAAVKDSAKVPGGIITVSAGIDYSDFMELMTKYIDISASGSSNPMEIIKQLDVAASVTVTDYNGNQTFKLDGFSEIESIINDIAKNIGKIIQ